MQAVAQRAGRLPQELLRDQSLGDVFLNAEILAASKAERRARVQKMLVGATDPLAICVALLSEIYVEL